MKRQIFHACSLFIVSAVAVATLVAPAVGAAKCKPVTVMGYPAWSNGLECQGENPMPKALNDVWVIALNIITWLMVTAGYVALVFIIIGGFEYITAAGEPSKIEKGKSAITNAIIGLIIVLISVVIVQAVQNGIAGGPL